MPEDSDRKEPDALRAGASSDSDCADVDDALKRALSLYRDSIMDEFELSPRERDVVNAILDGETRASAAKRLFITERTVKFHLENTYRKTGVACKNELIQLFMPKSV